MWLDVVLVTNLFNSVLNVLGVRQVDGRQSCELHVVPDNVPRVFRLQVLVCIGFQRARQRIIEGFLLVLSALDRLRV